MKKEAKNKFGVKDIAQLANVSIGTVDRVLHNRGEVSLTTKNAILKIIDEHGYTPNLIAKSLSSKKNYTISILIPDYKNDNPYWEKPLKGINIAEAELRNYNFNVKIFSFNLDNENSFRNSAREILESNFDGLVFAPIFYEASLEIINRCNKDNIPYVFFDVSIDDSKSLAFYGQNAYMSGYLAGKLMSYALDDSTEVLILKGKNISSSGHHLDKREQGFRAFFLQLKIIRLLI